MAGHSKAEIVSALKAAFDNKQLPDLDSGNMVFMMSKSAYLYDASDHNGPNIVRTFKPYKGGNNLLWALNEVANTNKPAIISPMAAASGLLIAASTCAKDSLMVPPRWDRTKNEMVLFRVREGGEIQMNFTIALHIAMCDIEFVDRQPAFAVLNAFVRIVEGIVMSIEAEANRIGL